ncbi:MAG: hypothetical protein V3U65_02990 [Granulosicoccaceae bacterium]
MRHDFYSLVGNSPLVLKKELSGFIATRLQEALHLVVSVENT